MNGDCPHVCEHAVPVVEVGRGIHRDTFSMSLLKEERGPRKVLGKAVVHKDFVPRFLARAWQGAMKMEREMTAMVGQIRVCGRPDLKCIPYHGENE